MAGGHRDSQFLLGIAAIDEVLWLPQSFSTYAIPLEAFMVTAPPSCRPDCFLSFPAGARRRWRAL
jgi:hypothetical protein